MGQWKEESPQQQTFRSVHDVVSLESRSSNRGSIKDLCSTKTAANMDNNCCKVVHAFGARHFLQNLSDDKVEHIRKTMLRHEEMFKEQVQALHRLYNMQRLVMHELRKLPCCPPNLSTFPTTAYNIENNVSEGFDIKGELHQASPYKHEENHTISITTPKSLTHLILKAENNAKSSSQSSLWESDKSATKSTVTGKKVKKTIDLERPPEEYLDDLDDFSENEERETREAGKPDRASISSKKISNTDNIGSTGKVNSMIQMEEKISRQREWFRTDIGRPSERENWENMPLKRLKGSEDKADLETDLKPAINIDQEMSTPIMVQSTSGVTNFSRQECKNDKESSQWESNNIDQALQGKKENWSFDVELKDKPSDIKTKPPPWFPQAPIRGKSNPENDSSSQKSSWMLAPVFTQPQGWKFVGSSEDSFIPGKGIISSSKDGNISSKTQDIDKKILNKEVENCEEPETTQEKLTRCPKESFQTILATNPYGGASQLTPVVLTQGYPIGAAIPAVGLQWSLEGHPALAAQGFVFPAVNKNNEAGPVPNPLSGAWCPQGTYIQFYPYQQQVIHDHRYPVPCQSSDQTSMHNRGHIESCTPAKSISQTEHPKSLQAQTQQCYEERSSVNGPAGFTRHQHSSIQLSNSPVDIHFKLVENDRTVGHPLDSRDSQMCNHSEGRISFTRNHQLGDPYKSVNTDEKRQIHAEVSRCSNCSLDTQHIEGQQEQEDNRDCKYELQSKQALSTEQTVWSRVLVDESETKGRDRSDSSQLGKGNGSLMEKRDTFHGECSAGQAVSQESKELQPFANKVFFCKTTDIQQQDSDEKKLAGFKIEGKQSQPVLSDLEDKLSIDASQKMHWLSIDMSENCASQMQSQKESQKIEDLDSSGHGSNNVGTHEGKQCRGEYEQHLDPITKEYEGQKHIETDQIHRRTEPVQIKETESALVDNNVQHSQIYFQALTSKALQSQDILHLGKGEIITNNSHAKDQGSPTNDLGDVKKEEFGSGETDMENVHMDRLRQRSQNESLTDTQIKLRSSCIKHMLDLQGDQAIIQRVPSKDKSSEATKIHKEHSISSQESKGGSEEEEACESLAAKILLSLAPSKPQVKGMSKRSVSITKRSTLQQEGQPACVGSSSSHSSRDGTYHGNERRSSARQNKPRIHDTSMRGGPVGWTKSIRGKRRRTQRPRN